MFVIEKTMNDENLQTDLSFAVETNVYYDLYVPENAAKSSPLLVAVHGYGAHKRYMMREARLIAPDDFVVASIQAPHQHFRQTDSGYKVGFGWLTDFKSAESIAAHHQFLLKLIENLKFKQIIDAENVYLYGFSQACALDFRFALTHPRILRGLIGISGGIPSDLETNENYTPTDAEVLYLFGDDDEFYALEKFRKYEEKLKNFLPRVESKLYSAKHEITDEMRADAKRWLDELSTGKI